MVGGHTQVSNDSTWLAPHVSNLPSLVNEAVDLLLVEGARL